MHKSAIALSAEDDLVVSNEQFGIPLAIYRQRKSCTRTAQGIATGFSLIALAGMIFHLYFISHNLLDSHTFINILVYLFTLSIACYTLFITIPESRNSRLIACEKGLLHIQRKREKDVVQAFHWSSIQTLTQDSHLVWICYPAYTLHYIQAGAAKTCTLHYDCAGLENLVPMTRPGKRRASRMKQRSS